MSCPQTDCRSCQLCTAGTHVRFEGLVKRLQDVGYQRALQLVQQRRPVIEQVASELCSNSDETVKGQRLVELLHNTPLEDAPTIEEALQLSQAEVSCLTAWLCKSADKMLLSGGRIEHVRMSGADGVRYVAACNPQTETQKTIRQGAKDRCQESPDAGSRKLSWWLPWYW